MEGDAKRYEEPVGFEFEIRIGQDDYSDDFGTISISSAPYSQCTACELRLLDAGTIGSAGFEREFHGPRLSLSAAEVRALIDVLHIVLKACPSEGRVFRPHKQAPEAEDNPQPPTNNSAE